MVPELLVNLPAFHLPVAGRKEWGVDISVSTIHEFAAEDTNHTAEATQSNGLSITHQNFCQKHH